MTRIASFIPHPRLAAFVECYWTLRAPGAAGWLEPILPDACPELIIHFGARPARAAAPGETVRQPTAFIYCAARRPVRLHAGGPMDIFAVRFRPWGLRVFTSATLAGALDQEVDLDAVLAPRAREIGGRIGAGDNDAARVRAADEALLSALEDTRAVSRVDRAVAVGLNQASSPADLARRLDIAPRTLRRRFTDAIGVGPRAYFKIVRFQRAARAIASGRRLADAAAICGYADQAHMTRDFATLAGVTPGRLAASWGAGVVAPFVTDRPNAPWADQSA